MYHKSTHFDDGSCFEGNTPCQMNVPRSHQQKCVWKHTRSGCEYVRLCGWMRRNPLIRCSHKLPKNYQPTFETLQPKVKKELDSRMLSPKRNHMLWPMVLCRCEINFRCPKSNTEIDLDTLKSTFQW